MKTFVSIFVLAAAAMAQPVAQLPQHVIDSHNGELIHTANLEARPRYRFRCLKAVDQQSCTMLARMTVDGKDAYRITRALVEPVVKAAGLNWKVALMYESALGLGGGAVFVATTDRGTANLNAIWVAMWLNEPGATDETVKDKIKSALASIL